MKSLSTILSLIQKNKPFLQKKYPIKSIGVFGSVARGESDGNSDIDILVEFAKPVGIEFIDLANELESLLQQKVDLISRAGIKPKYLNIIEKDLHYV